MFITYLYGELEAEEVPYSDMLSYLTDMEQACRTLGFKRDRVFDKYELLNYELVKRLLQTLKTKKVSKDDLKSYLKNSTVRNKLVDKSIPGLHEVIRKNLEAMRVEQCVLPGEIAVCLVACEFAVKKAQSIYQNEIVNMELF